MGKISKGILGGFRGRVGTVVGSKIFGIDVMRSYQPNVRNPRTIGQVSQRSRFSFVVLFLRAFLRIIRVGYSLKAIKQSAFNACVSINVKNAVSGAYPNYAIDYAKVMFAKGPLLKANSLFMDENVAEAVSIGIHQNCLNIDPEYDDLAYGVFYNLTKDQVMTSKGVLKRSDWDVNVVPELWEVGDVVHGWVFYTSPDGVEISDSSYAGSTILIAA